MDVMKNNLLSVIASWFIAGLLLGMPLFADEQPERNSAAVSSPIKIVVSTLFQGDVNTANQYSDKLCDEYRSFLDGFVQGHFCSGASYDVQEACRMLRHGELRRILSGADWADGFVVTAAEFNNELNQASFAAYEFSKNLRVDNRLSCDFQLHLQDVFDLDPRYWTYEYSYSCHPFTRP